MPRQRVLSGRVDVVVRVRPVEERLPPSQPVPSLQVVVVVVAQQKPWDGGANADAGAVGEDGPAVPAAAAPAAGRRARDVACRGRCGGGIWRWHRRWFGRTVLGRPATQRKRFSSSWGIMPHMYSLKLFGEEWKILDQDDALRHSSFST